MGLIGTAILDLIDRQGSAGARGEVRSTEQSLLSNPAKWLSDIISGGESEAGVAINEKTAESITTAWRCVNNIAEDTAKLPIELIRIQDDGLRNVIRKHPALYLLNGKANQYTTSFVFRETIKRNAVGWGNGYAEIVRNMAGEAVELWNLPPGSVQPQWIKGPGDRWLLQYICTSPITGRVMVLKPQDILHIRGPGDDVVGFSPVKLFRTAMGLTKAAENTGARFFGRGMRPSGVILHPKTLSGEASRNLRESMERRFSGPDNEFRVMVVEEGAEWKQTSIPPEDAQFLETRGFQVDEVCRIYRMPPHKVQNLARSTNNNIEHQGIEYVTDTLGAWFKRAEGEYTNKLLSEKDAGAGFEHDDHDLTRGDQKSRAETAQIYINAGVWCADDVLARESMNPQPNGTGKQHLVPSTMMTREALGKRDERAVQTPLPNAPAPAPDPAADPKKDGPEEPAAKRSRPDQIRSVVSAMAPVIENLMAAKLKIEIDRAQRSCKAMAAAAWAADFYTEHEVVVRGELAYLAETMVLTLRVTDSGEPTVSIAELARLGAAKICCDARSAISATGNVEAALEGWRNTRAAADTRSIVEVWINALSPST